MFSEAHQRYRTLRWDGKIQADRWFRYCLQELLQQAPDYANLREQFYEYDSGLSDRENEREPKNSDEYNWLAARVCLLQRRGSNRPYVWTELVLF